MIVKGKSRGNGKQLASYLLSDPKNEQAELVSSLGFEPGSLEQQLVGAERLALIDTRGKKPLYHAQLRAGAGDGLTPDQWREAVDIAERHLGFKGLERVIVRHRLDGEDHVHVVWNRHDKRTDTLRDDSNDAAKRKAAAREIEARFGLRQLDKGRGEPGKARVTDDEARQDDRAVKTKAERVAEITALWKATDSGKAFRAALEDAGYALATGKSRAFCVVDGNGEVHSLARQIDGAKAKDVAARLADVTPASIPDAADIRRAMVQAKKDRDGSHTKDNQQTGIGGGDYAPDAAEAAEDFSRPELPEVRRAAREDTDQETAAAILRGITRHNSTFTRNELERAVAKVTGHEGREAWMTQDGGLEALTGELRQHAAASYEKWAATNQRAAARYDLADYVTYAQDREAARRDETDPEDARARAEKRAAFRGLLSEIDASDQVTSVGPDSRGRERFTTRDMLATELRLEAAGASLAERKGHGVKDGTREIAQTHTEAAAGFALSDEQAAALAHVTAAGDLALVVGYAGAGKSTMLNAARAAWEAEGFRVQGTALSGIAGDGLQQSAGIKSDTLWKFLHRIETQEERGEALQALDGRIAGITSRSAKANKFRADLTRQRSEMAADIDAGRLTERDVIVVDEAAMVGARDMDRLLSAAHQAGAKVVLVGDHEQLQSIEAGAGFRSLMERHGAAQITTIMRQREDWQREASKAFPEGRPREALEAYRAHGMTHEAETRDDAKAALVAAWTQAGRDHPEQSRIVLAHSNADVGDLNRIARAACRESGRLGEDHEVKLRDGTLPLADGDRLLFGRNDRQLGVKNGTLGTVEKIEGGKITVAVDGKADRRVTFDVADYHTITHGYAATVHKTQGVTVDRTFVLASGGMDKNMSYVAMTRHRERADLFHAREDFRDHAAMTARLSRTGMKDAVLDYLGRAAQPEAAPMPGAFRKALGDAWQAVKDAFARKGEHPAEARARAHDEADAARKAEAARQMAEALRQEQVRQAEEARRAALAAEEAERRRRAALTPTQRMVEDARAAVARAGQQPRTPAQDMVRRTLDGMTAEQRAAYKAQAEAREKAARELAAALKRSGKDGGSMDGPG